MVSSAQLLGCYKVACVLEGSWGAWGWWHCPYFFGLFIGKTVAAGTLLCQMPG